MTDTQGVPLRLELGPRDIANNSTIAVRRYDNHKEPMPLADIGSTVKQYLEDIQQSMYDRAKATMDEHVVNVTKWEDVVPTLDAKNILALPWCETEACEDTIKDRSKSQ